MNKNILIAFLLGMLTVVSVRAQQAELTKKDVLEAAALAGILANPAHDPFGVFSFNWRQPKDYMELARSYASGN